MSWETRALTLKRTRPKTYAAICEGLKQRVMAVKLEDRYGIDRRLISEIRKALRGYPSSLNRPDPPPPPPPGTPLPPPPPLPPPAEKDFSAAAGTREGSRVERDLERLRKLLRRGIPPKVQAGLIIGLCKSLNENMRARGLELLYEVGGVSAQVKSKGSGVQLAPMFALPTGSLGVSVARPLPVPRPEESAPRDRDADDL